MILSGKSVEDRVQVYAAPAGPLSPGPTICGWVADGGPANSNRLIALATVAYCVSSLSCLQIHLWEGGEEERFVRYLGHTTGAAATPLLSLPPLTSLPFFHPSILPSRPTPPERGPSRGVHPSLRVPTRGGRENTGGMRSELTSYYFRCLSRRFRLR